MSTANRTFRVFVSSTFEDLREERDALQREVFPRLRKLCEEHGARFQAIDLRWGVRDEAALDHRTMDICLTEIERCQGTGVRPNFIVLLGDRYGWRPLPAHIEAEEFERVRSQIPDEAMRVLVDTWYQRDDNAVPAEYLLKPRTGKYVDKSVWEGVEQQLHRTLREAAHAVGLRSEVLVKYETSATHQEILQGLGKSAEERRHVFAFLRTRASREPDDPSLSALRDSMRAELSENVLDFPAGDMAKLCAEAMEHIKTMILAEAARFESRSPLELETQSHNEFAFDRMRHFGGRERVLKGITAHIRGNERRPLVVRGPSGCGKSAIMAKASAQAAAEQPLAVILRRFIGVTPESSSGITLLRSLCQELSQSYRAEGDELPTGFQSLVVGFHDRLTRATRERPLILFLDALDQLPKDDPAHSFSWLMETLPQNVTAVFSTTDVPEALVSLPCLEVEEFAEEEASVVLARWLKEARRTLQPAQWDKVLAYFGRSGLPLYLKLAFDEARRWRSFEGDDECMLGEGLAGMLDVLFDRLSKESNHGVLMVSRSLGHLAAARYGLTEDEMRDILTADDDLWQDFTERARHSPPERQLPVIVWSRLHLDLNPYLAERAVPGGRVMVFYHQQVAERVGARYLAGKEGVCREAALARYFGGQPYWLDADRRRPNERKVTELVGRRIGAGELEQMAETLTDLDYISAKCGAGLVTDLEQDYQTGIEALPEARAEVAEEGKRQGELERWTREIVAYAQQWSKKRRKGRAELEPVLPKVVDSVKPWDDPKIGAKKWRAESKPSRLDGIQAFRRFVVAESHHLTGYGGQTEFVVQQAYNSANSGPVPEHASAWINREGSAGMLLRLRNCLPEDNPLPACLRTMVGLGGWVFSVDITPDGRMGAAGSLFGGLDVWDFERGVLLRTLVGHTGPVKCVAITPDGRQAVSGGRDKALRVWDLRTGVCVRILDGHTEEITSVALTADGNRAVSGSEDQTLRVWNLETGVCLRTLEGHDEKITCVALTPDGRRAVSGGWDHTLRVWDLERLWDPVGVCLRTLEERLHLVANVAVTPDGQQAVSISDDILKLWNLETGKCLRALDGHTQDNITCVAITSDGRWAVLGGQDGKLHIWDVERGLCPRILEGHTSAVMGVAVTPDGRRAVSGGRDETLRVWDLEKGTSLQPTRRGTAMVTNLALALDGRCAVSASLDRTLRVWNAETGAWERDLEGHTSIVTSVAVTSDGLAISGSEDRTLRIWDLRTGVSLQTSEGHTEKITSVALAPGGLLAVSGSDDHTLRVWELKTGACSRILKGHSDRIAELAVTLDGRRAISVGFDKTLRVWDLTTGLCLQTLKGHAETIQSLALTPDGRRAVSGSVDGTLRVWDLEMGICLCTRDAHPEGVKAVALTPDGKRVVSGGNSVVVWDLQGSGRLRWLNEHRDLARNAPWLDKSVFYLAVAPDGQRMMVGARGTLQILDLETGACECSVTMNSRITAVAFSAMCKRLVVGTSSGETLFFVHDFNIGAPLDT